MKSAIEWPSGAAASSFAMPVLPVAPGTLRIGIETLSSGSISLLTRRASWSAPPPGPQGTMNSTGREGKDCAKARRGDRASAEPASKRVRRLSCMVSSWWIYVHDTDYFRPHAETLITLSALQLALLAAGAAAGGAI